MFFHIIHIQIFESWNCLSCLTLLWVQVAVLAVGGILPTEFLPVGFYSAEFLPVGY